MPPVAIQAHRSHVTYQHLNYESNQPNSSPDIAILLFSEKWAWPNYVIFYYIQNLLGAAVPLP